MAIQRRRHKCFWFAIFTIYITSRIIQNFSISHFAIAVSRTYQILLDEITYYDASSYNTISVTYHVSKHPSAGSSPQDLQIECVFTWEISNMSITSSTLSILENRGVVSKGPKVRTWLSAVTQTEYKVFQKELQGTMLVAFVPRARQDRRNFLQNIHFFCMLNY